MGRFCECLIPSRGLGLPTVAPNQRFCGPTVAASTSALARYGGQVAAMVGILRPDHERRMVDQTGIEPVTSSMPLMRAPNCATGPLGKLLS